MKSSCHTVPLCLVGLTAAFSSCREKEAEKPNIIVILADDMGWGDLAINGNPYVKTPVLDVFSKQSLSFDRFYVCPLSAPTRSELLTGRYFLRTGVSSVTQGYENMRTEEVTIAEILKQNGYTTGCFGKWHNGGYYLQHPNRQGFDEYIGFCMGHLGYYYDMEFVHNDSVIKSSGYTTDFFTDKALEFIEKNKDTTFLCYIPYNVPHSPFQVPEEYFSAYINSGIDSTLSSIYGMVQNMDHNIGRILEKLDKLNISENTIVIFLSDNGPNTFRYNGAMKGKKGNVDEGGIRTPFFIRWPGKIPPGVTDQLGQDIDMLPTILSLCNIKYVSEKSIDGLDLSQVILGKENSSDRYIFSREAYQDLAKCSASVRNNRYRLVRTSKDTLLYDMVADPSQLNDISADEKDVMSSMSGILGKWEKDLISSYVPVTTIRAGFQKEKSFILPVQDAILTGNLRYSSIHPNQAYTEGWKDTGDSLYWNLEIEDSGVYDVEFQYGCPPGKQGSKFIISSLTNKVTFIINDPFESVVLPERDYVTRSESVERTWAWMEAGKIRLVSGDEQVVLKLIKPSSGEAGIVKALKISRVR